MGLECTQHASNYKFLSTQLVELCTPVERFIGAYPQGTESEADIVPINTENIRADGITEPIQVGYRLRSYNTATGGNGERLLCGGYRSTWRDLLAELC